MLRAIAGSTQMASWVGLTKKQGSVHGANYNYGAAAGSYMSPATATSKLEAVDTGAAMANMAASWASAASAFSAAEYGGSGGHNPGLYPSFLPGPASHHLASVHLADSKYLGHIAGRA